MKEFLTIGEVSDYLHIKKSTLYSKVEKGEIPHYKIGHLVRFRKEEIDAWMEKSRVEPLGGEEKAREIVHGAEKSLNIDAIVKKAIVESGPSDYNPRQGRPDQKRIRGLGKEV